jgi:Tol biopolymer transport system component
VSPDGRFLALADRESAAGVESITLLTIATGEKRRLTSPSAEWPFGDAAPVFSPDGRMLAFGRAAGMLVSDIYVQPLSSDTWLSVARLGGRVAYAHPDNYQGRWWTAGAGHHEWRT